MRRSIATVSLSGTLRQKLEAIAAAGFDGYELFEPDFTNARCSAAELRAMGADLGLTLELFQPLRDIEGLPADAFRRALDRAERKFDLMAALGCPLVLVCSNTSPLALDDAALAAEQLHELARRAAARNLRVGYEALAWGRHVNRWRQAWNIVESAAHPHLGLILDSFHTLSLGDDAGPIADVPGERIAFVQMADAPRLAMNVIEWARHHRNFPGQGQLDVVGFFEQAVRAGYSGPLSLEIFNDVFRAAPNRRVAVDAMRSLRWLEGQVRDRLQAAGDPQAATALQRQTLFAPPPAPRFGGYAYVEIAVDADGAEALGALLGTLGFRRVGRHRSKPVLLFRQGDARVVLNVLGDDVARARFAAQGPAVCALGLTVDDATGALNRATALLSARHVPPVGPGEQALPSIVAPGGTVVQFVDAALGAVGQAAADFAPDDTTPDDGLVAAVDHVAVGVVPDRFDTWILFARAVLGLEAADSVQIADPLGLVRSAGLADAARRLRLVLNAGLGPNTAIARSALAGGGVALQHVAFACTDLLAAVERLRARGVAFLPVSDNVYDDLPTRFELEPAFVERLRAAGVLFDRSAGGDYLHAWLQPHVGLAFELVQRIGGYDGHGAANAPVRMASQAHEGDAAFHHEPRR
jgi:4-hydroxyphenylpyruvate dioxygenase